MSASRELDRPIIVLGPPRCGTTLMGRILGHHDVFYSAVEPRLVWKYGNDLKSDMLNSSDARPNVVRYIRAEFARQVRAAGRQRLLEKTPSNALRPAFVHTIMPEARFIHIMRHGLDSVPSIRRMWLGYSHGVRGIEKGRVLQRLREVGLRRMPFYALEATRRLIPGQLMGLNAWGPRLPGIRSLRRELDLLAVCALQWRTCVETTRHFGNALPPDRYIEIKLEELDVATMERVIAFTGVDDGTPILDAFLRIYDVQRPGSGRDQLSGSERDLLLSWIEPTLDWLGYPARERRRPNVSSGSGPSPASG